MTRRPFARMYVLIWTVLIVTFYVIHQDLWFWHAARPLVFGFLPIGLAYHAAYCVGASLLMWALTIFAWPVQLERSSRVPLRAPDNSCRGGLRAPDGPQNKVTPS
jgi:hypothetical protein